MITSLALLIYLVGVALFLYGISATYNSVFAMFLAFFSLNTAKRFHRYEDRIMDSYARILLNFGFAFLLSLAWPYLAYVLYKRR